jgi:hypothetical protein
MTEKQPQLKTAKTPEEIASDKTVVDAAKARAEAVPETPSSEQPGFNPYKFSRIVVSPELRQEMSRAKLPRLAPEILQDTVPPNRPFTVAGGSPDAELVIPLVAKRRPATAVVVVCLLGLIFVLALAIVPSLRGRPEQGLTPTHTPTTAIATPARPLQIIASAASLPEAPTLPIAKPNPEVLATSHELVSAPASTTQISRTKSAAEHGNSTHSSPDRTAPSKLAPPALAATPPVVETPPPTATPNVPIPPARSSWFHK